MGEDQCRGVIVLAMSNLCTDDKYADPLAKKMAIRYDDLSREIDASLVLVLDALVLAGGDDNDYGDEVIALQDEVDKDDIANMLLKRLPRRMM